jgi:thiamine phosphate synthase YjbQ (UPF0047 family)
LKRRTGTIEPLVRQSGAQEGLCLVNARHITADNNSIMHCAF